MICNIVWNSFLFILWLFGTAKVIQAPPPVEVVLQENVLMEHIYLLFTEK